MGAHRFTRRVAIFGSNGRDRAPVMAGIEDVGAVERQEALGRAEVDVAHHLGEEHQQLVSRDRHQLFEEVVVERLERGGLLARL